MSISQNKFKNEKFRIMIAPADFDHVIKSLSDSSIFKLNKCKYFHTTYNHAVYTEAKEEETQSDPDFNRYLLTNEDRRSLIKDIQAMQDKISKHSSSCFIHTTMSDDLRSTDDLSLHLIDRLAINPLLQDICHDVLV